MLRLWKAIGQITYDIVYMWNLKHDTNELIYKTEKRLTDIENGLVIAKGEGRQGGMD